VTTCTIGTMAPNATVTVTEVVTVTVAVSGGAVSNTAVVGGQQPDPNRANNSASANIAISGVAVATATPTGVLSPTPTSVVVPPGQSPPATSGQPGVPCTTQIGGTCSVTGAVTGTFTKIGSMTFNVTATGPTTSAPRGVPAVFIPTTVGVESFGCTALPLSAPFVATCTGTTRGDLLLGAIVTVHFPLTGGGTQDITGTVTTAAAIAPNVQQAIALVRPSGVDRIPCADSIGQTCNVAGAVTGIGAVTGSMTWTLTANVPAGTVAGTVPVVVFSTTAGLEGFPCSPVGAGATTVACTVTTVGNAIIGSNVTVVFAAGITSVGTVSGPGPAALAALGAAPLLPPFAPPFPPLPPPPGLLLPPLDPSAGLVLPPSSMMMAPSSAGIPVVPVADSLVLLAGGLVAVGAIAAQRWWRRRWED
jgi:hypothetical protein